MGRLSEEFLERVESFCERTVGVAEELAKRKVSLRIVDQVMASGTSVGANVFEADEAMSSADFVKCLAIATKELNEFRFWLRLSGRRGWISPDRLKPLAAEAEELKKIFGSMIARSRRRS